MTVHQKMEFEKLDAPFVDKDEDIATGDVVTIMSEAKDIPDRFNAGEFQTVIKIKTKNGLRYITLNQKSVNILVDELKSNDDKNWVGKNVKVLLNHTMIGSKKCIVAYLAGLAWELDNYGDPMSETHQEGHADDVPTIDVDDIEGAEAPDDDDEIKVEDIPF